VEPDSAVGAHLLTSSTSLQDDYRQLSSLSTPMAGLITELIELQIDLLIMCLELLLQGFVSLGFYCFSLLLIIIIIIKKKKTERRQGKWKSGVQASVERSKRRKVKNTRTTHIFMASFSICAEQNRVVLGKNFPKSKPKKATSNYLVLTLSLSSPPFFSLSL